MNKKIMYKFRAECKRDVLDLLNILPKGELVTIKLIPDVDGLPDVEVELEMNGTLIYEVRGCMRLVPDGHVMVQTVALIEDYTGKRNYNL